MKISAEKRKLTEGELVENEHNKENVIDLDDNEEFSLYEESIIKDFVR